MRVKRHPNEASRETWLTPRDFGDNDVIANDVMQLERCSRSLSKPDFSPSSNSVGWWNASFFVVIWCARRGKTDSLRSHATATVVRVSLIRSKNRVYPIGVEIVAWRNEILRLLDFRWLHLPSPPFRARRQGRRPGRRDGCPRRVAWLNSPRTKIWEKRATEGEGELETISLASPARRLWFEYIQLAARASNAGSATETLKGATRYFVRAILATVHVVVVFALLPLVVVATISPRHSKLYWTSIDERPAFYSHR